MRRSQDQRLRTRQPLQASQGKDAGMWIGAANVEDVFLGSGWLPRRGLMAGVGECAGSGWRWSGAERSAQDRTRATARSHFGGDKARMLERSFHERLWVRFLKKAMRPAT